MYFLKEKNNLFYIDQKMLEVTDKTEEEEILISENEDLFLESL